MRRWRPLARSLFAYSRTVPRMCLPLTVIRAIPFDMMRLES